MTPAKPSQTELTVEVRLIGEVGFAIITTVCRHRVSDHANWRSELTHMAVVCYGSVLEEVKCGIERRQKCRSLPDTASLSARALDALRRAPRPLRLPT